MDIIISANETILHIINDIPIGAQGGVTLDVFQEIVQNADKGMRNDLQHYKCSIYNYCAARESYILIYNTLYSSLVRLDVKEYRQYLGEIQAEKELVRQFIETGLWVGEKLDERRKYLACAKMYTLDMPRPISVTITTTLKCNAQCSYCYEKGVVRKDLCEGAMDDIYSFIERKTKQKAVRLNWFGGEPLLNIEVMDQLCARLDAGGFQYFSYIITNGSKINNVILNEKLKLWHVHDVQVTLDGTQQIYEQRKNYIDKEEGQFYRILNNIRLLAEQNVFVHIRLNMDRENKENIIELVKQIEPIFSSYENVVFYPAFLTGVSSPLTEDERILCVKELLQSLQDVKKLTTGTKFYSLPRMHACMNGDPYSFSIDVDGNLYTCEHHVGNKVKAMCNIRNLHGIVDNRGEENKFREECNACVFFPKCFGGCEANYQNEDDPCMIEKYMIKAYLELL